MLQRSKVRKERRARRRGRPERLFWAIGSAAMAFIIVTVAFRLLPPLAALETRLNDFQRVILAPKQEAQDSRVAIVTLTEETLVQFPYRSPVDRAYLARLVNALADAKAKMIVLDVLFDQPTESEKDRALIEALKAFPGAKVAAWGDTRSGLIEAQSRYLAHFAEESGLSLGFANVITDDDGVVRRFITRLPGTDRLSLSGEAAKALTGKDPPDSGVIDWTPPKNANATLFQQIPSLRLTDPPNEALRVALGRALAGRTVYIGADLEQTDRHQTSLGVDPANRRTIPGVVVQAAVFTQLLDGRAPPIASPALVSVIVTAMVALGAAIGLTRWNLIWKSGAAAAILIAYLGFVWLLASDKTLFSPVAPALAGLFLSALLGISLDSYLVQRDERFIRRAFSHYLEPAMVDQLARDPHALRLGGERREISLLFTDIEGFTTIAEELPPDQLTRLLNEYFDELSDIILAHGGAIDKFIGDAIVAHFGAPRSMDDHALKALLCAAELDRAAQAFRARNSAYRVGVTRIGVHTGVAVVGNFGGRARFDYTAMGDAVNIAARLENANKRYGTRVAVSEQTVEAARINADPGVRLPPLQTIGKILLKGKRRLVSVFAMNTESDEDYVRDYEAAFGMIELAPEKARAALEELQLRDPSDPLVRWQLDRLRSGKTSAVIGEA